MTRYDNFREILDQLLITSCMWLKLISFANMDAQYRQNRIGGTIAIMIILILLNGILFVLISLCQTIYQLCVLSYRFIKAKKIGTVAPVPAAIPVKPTPEVELQPESPAKPSDLTPVETRPPPVQQANPSTQKPARPVIRPVRMRVTNMLHRRPDHPARMNDSPKPSDSPQ